MKRNLLVIVGALLVLILLVIWLYLMFFSNPNATDEGGGGGVFSNLDFGDTTDRAVDGDQINPELANSDNDSGTRLDGTVDLQNTDETLRQLTTKNVIGFGEVLRTPSSTKELYYVESGVGHIFSIDLKTGEERRVSATTIAATRDADISPNGSFVVIQSGDNGNRSTVVGTIDRATESITTEPLENAVVSFAMTTDNELLYAVETTNSLVGKVYNFTSATSRTLFTTPFREARIIWGDTVDSTHYLFPKTSSQLEGFVFEVNNGTFSRLPIDGLGLSANGDESYVLFTKREEGDYSSHIYNTTSSEIEAVTIEVLPEKCAFGSAADMYIVCARDFQNSYSIDLPDSWYKGVTAFADELWYISPFEGTAEVIQDVSKVSGRDLDIIDLEFGRDDEFMYFRNKTDNSIWMFVKEDKITGESDPVETVNNSENPTI